MAPVRGEALFSRPFLFCSLSNLLQGIAFSLFLHLPGFLEELGAGPVMIGWVFSLTSGVAIAARPALGSIMDRHGRRGVIIAGHLLNVAVTGLYLTIDVIGPWMYAVRILHGLSEATLFTVLFTYAADRVPASRLTEGLAIFGVSGMLPMSLGGLLGDWILAGADYALLFVVAWGFSLVALLAALPLRDEPRRGGGSAGQEGRPRGFTSSLLQADLLPLWWISAVFFTALAGIFVFLKTYVMARQVGSVGSFFSAYTVVAIGLRVGLGWLPDRIGPKRVLLPALVALSAGLLGLAVARSDTAVMAAGVLCGIGHGYTFPILFGLVVSRARGSERGTAIAIYTGLADLGILLGGPLLGLVLDHWGYGVAYASVAAAVVSGAAIFVLWDRRGARRPPDEVPDR